MTAPLPVGFALAPDRNARWSRDGRCLYGGTPWRLLMLTEVGVGLARRLLAGEEVRDRTAGLLARRLTDAGLAHPLPAATADLPLLEVVVPAYDRVDALARCLDGLGSGLPVVVVDDGSADGKAIAAVADAHGARVHRLDRNRGPAAARNAGLAATTADVVAFVDSDCVVTADDLRLLAAHLADPQVGAVAPRVRAVAHADGPGWLAVVRSPLDLGPDPARVRPQGRVGYVPTTALLVRRQAVREAGGFDEALRHGEDVDLCWRLTDADWDVRYDSRVTVWHTEPTTWSGWLGRSFRYGTSAGPLGRRHGARVAGPLVSGLLLRLPEEAKQQLPREVHRRLVVAAPVQTTLGLLQWAVPLWWPLLLVAGRRGEARRAATAATVLAPALIEWVRRRPPVDPVRYAVAATVTDAAYGAGVWCGAVRTRSSTPLRPRRRSAVTASSTRGCP